MIITEAKLETNTMGDRESRDIMKQEKRNTPNKPKIKPPFRDGKENSDIACRAKLETSMDNLSRDLTKCKIDQPDQTPYDHPVYKQISRQNGQINRADLSSLKYMCKLEQIDSSGKLNTVKQRLKSHFRNKMLKEAGLMKPSIHRTFDYFLVVDFEATCESKNLSSYPHEIIEFPGVLVDARTGQEVDSWREYVRPIINTQLSEFCTLLTGIEQSTVDEAATFPQVLASFSAWLGSHSLGSSHTFCLVTDGPFDVGRFLRLSCSQAGLPVPGWAHKWCNVRKAFANFYKQGNSGGYQKLPGLQTMLERLDMQFKGNPHSGLDDAKNIARVVSRIICDGGILKVNERLEPFPELHVLKSGNRPRLQNVAPVPRVEADQYLAKCKAQLTEIPA